MLKAHRDIQAWIKGEYSKSWVVNAEIDGKNYLPNKEKHWYEPDVVIRDHRGQILLIVEVENDPVRKAVVGASVLADASMNAIGQSEKPSLIFVVYAKKGINQITNFEDKLRIVRPYCVHMKQILVLSEAHFKRMSKGQILLKVNKEQEDA